MKARKLSRKSPAATLDMLKWHLERESLVWGELDAEVDVDVEVRFDSEPIDQEFFSIHTDGI